MNLIPSSFVGVPCPAGREMNDWIKCAFNVKNSCSLYEMHSSITQNLMVTDDCFFLFLVFQEMVFCYQNCSDLLWEKNILVIEINFWYSKLKNTRAIWSHSEKSKQSLDNRMLFKLVPWDFSYLSNKLEQLELKLENIIGI